MVLVNILGGLITTVVFGVVLLVFDWHIGLIAFTAIKGIYADSVGGKKETAGWKL